MRIYFDTCSLQRHLDDKTQLRVSLEAEAVLGILVLCETGEVSLVSCDVLVLENDRNPQAKRKAFVAGILEQAAGVIEVSVGIGTRRRNSKHGDSRRLTHCTLPCAEPGKVDYLCTCDDRMFKRAQRQSDLSVMVITPLELAQELAE